MINPKFEALVMTLFLLNTIIFCAKHYSEPAWWGSVHPPISLTAISYPLTDIKAGKNSC